MLKVYAGEDRVAAEKALKRELGAKYEVFEGGNLEVGDLPSIFLGVSLFETEQRRILLKDVSENGAVWEKLPDYAAETTHLVAVWESKLDKRSATYKALRAAGVEIYEFAALKRPEANLVFGILETALRNGPEAVNEASKIELTQDPYMFFGLMVTQAMKRFEGRPQGVRERELLKRLAELDVAMKSATVEPWTLIKAFLLTI